VTSGIVPRDRWSSCRGRLLSSRWDRHRDPLPDDPVLHICALAYMSDLTLAAGHSSRRALYLQVAR
jgi:acyl-CoA thioesterase